jgi:hypothetical protein
MANEDVFSGIADAEKTGYEEKSFDELQTLIESEKDIEAQQKLNREVFNRAKRAENALKKQNEGGNADAGMGGSKQQKPSDAPKISVIEFAELQAQGYSPADIVQISKLAEKYHVAPSEVIADPIMKAGFEATRRKAAVGSRTIPPSRRIATGTARPTRGSEKDSEAIKAAREAFNRNLAISGEETE